MSWQLTGLVSKKRIGSTARRMLLIAMADKANDDGSGVYASFATLANLTESSRPTVKRLVKEFLEEGLIRHVGMRRCSNGETNEYDIIVEAVEKLSEANEPRVKMNPVHGEPGSPQTGGKKREPGSPRPLTRVMVTPKPIQNLDLVSNETRSMTPTKVTPRGKRAKPAYRGDFEALWKSWPAAIRQNSDKRTAAARWDAALERWDAETLMRAASHYLRGTKVNDADPGPWKPRTCQVQVFLNGKLEAAVEAVTTPKSKGEAVWSAEKRMWIEA